MAAATFPPQPGTLHPLADGLAMVLCPNPSPMTGPGTNTFLVGTDELAVIDPGPADDSHLVALVAAIADRPVKYIIVTHSHLDHSPLAHPLAALTNASVVGFGDALAGQSNAMAALREAGLSGGGEGVDESFSPHHVVTDGDVLCGQGWALEVMHTPGHMGNHIALRWNNAAFVGDLVMGWSTSLVSPPDGDMGDFLRSCARVRDLDLDVLYAAHGAAITTPRARISEVMAHRDARTQAILAALAIAPKNVVTLVNDIYADLALALHPAAGRNVFAHLVDLCQTGSVTAEPVLSPDATFHLCNESR